MLAIDSLLPGNLTNEDRGFGLLVVPGDLLVWTDEQDLVGLAVPLHADTPIVRGVLVEGDIDLVSPCSDLHVPSIGVEPTASSVAGKRSIH